MTHRVLVVEDSPFQAEVLRDALEEAGMTTGLAGDGQEALEMLAGDQAWDMIVTDIMMPEMDGYELVRRLKADAGLATIPVTLLTTLNGPLDVIRGLECGADSFVTKPYEPEQLIQRIETVVRNHQSAGAGRFRMGIEVSLMGHSFTVNADRQQILDMLMSSFEELIESNEKLREGQQQLLATEGLLARTLAAARVVTWSLDIAAGSMTWSYNAPEVLGLSTDVRLDDLSSFLRRVVPDDVEQLSAIADRQPGDRSPLPDEWVFRVTDGAGQVRWMLARGEPWTEPATGRAHLRGVVLDISARKRLEIELQEAREEADAANRAKSEYLSRMSHELRTPLNTVIGFGQLLEHSELDEDDHDGVRRIVQAGRHLLRLIDDVLDIARIEAGRLDMEREPVDVTAALRAAADLLHQQAAQRDIDLRVVAAPAPLHVLADPQRLSQVLVNLVSNAVKYNVPSGAVTLRATVTAAGRIRLAVEDTGPGLSPESEERAFTPFDRLGAERTDTVGTGLGLPLSRSLTEAMGGTLGVHSTPGEGSTFWLELDAATEAATSTQRTGPDASVPATPTDIAGRVLHIEDNASNRALIAGLLQPYRDVVLLEAGTAADGLQIARTERPDLVLLDVNLPDGDGVELLRRLRAGPETRHIPVVIVSADASPAAIATARAAGAADYLTKPLDLGAVGTTLQQQLPAREP